MPVILQTVTARVTELIGRAFIRDEKGRMLPLKLDDLVVKGDVILTEQDAIVELTQYPDGVVVAGRTASGRALARTGADGEAEASRVIAGLERGDPSVAPGAGAAGIDGGLQPGLRVERIVELLDPSSGPTLAADPLRQLTPLVSGLALQPPAAEAPATPALSVGDASADESAGSITFTVTLSAPSTEVVTVGYTLVPGSANSPADFTSGGGTLTFAPGVTSQTVTVPVTDDRVYEGDETFILNLSDAVNATVADGVGEGRIVDDETPPQVVRIDPLPAGDGGVVTEGDPLVFSVSLSNPSATDTVLPFNLAAGAPGQIGAPVFSDGVTLNPDGTITVPAGVTSFSVSLPTDDDAVDEPDTPVTLTVGGVTSNGLVRDNDDAPTLTINDVRVDEAAGVAVFTVTLTGATTQSVSVDFATGNGTATAGADYTGQAGSLTFAPGVTSQTISVPILDDNLAEAAETFTVTLSAAVNAVITDGVGVATIIDDEGTRPELDLDGDDSAGVPGTGYVTTFVEDGAPVAIADVDLQITDPDADPLTGATVSLSNAQPGDVLAVGTLPAGIVATVVGPVVTFTGTASAADYEAAIRAVTFGNTSQDPDATPRRIEVTVSDSTGPGAAAVAIVNVVPVNDAPVANPASLAVVEDAPVVTGAVTAVDPDGDPLSFALTAPPPAGLSFNPDGTYSFDPSAPAYQALAAGQVQVITVPYTVDDGQGGTATANLVITITGTDDLPVISVGTGAVTEDTAPTTSGTLTATDADNPALAFVPTTQTGAYGALTLSDTGAWSYTLGPSAQALAAGQVVTETFTVTLNDGSTTTVTITVTGTDDLPVISCGHGCGRGRHGTDDQRHADGNRCRQPGAGLRAGQPERRLWCADAQRHRCVELHPRPERAGVGRWSSGHRDLHRHAERRLDHDRHDHGHGHRRPAGHQRRHRRRGGRHRADDQRHADGHRRRQPGAGLRAGQPERRLWRADPERHRRLELHARPERAGAGRRTSRHRDLHGHAERRLDDHGDHHGHRHRRPAGHQRRHGRRGGRQRADDQRHADGHRRRQPGPGLRAGQPERRLWRADARATPAPGATRSARARRRWPAARSSPRPSRSR